LDLLSWETSQSLSVGNWKGYKYFILLYFVYCVLYFALLQASILQKMYLTLHNLD
jgi:hypothetical protein